MVDPTPSDYNLTYLRERWERDRSSRIFLQLAEEYRRRGLHTEALEVLETGLGFHPGYLAAQVALGRCRLEAGQADVAVKVLERVLTQDPTQAVATRLLAESWLALGDEDKAQAAIDRCRLIGIPPSELVGLDQRMIAARKAARDRWAEPVEPALPLAPAPAPAPEPVVEAPLPWQEKTAPGDSVPPSQAPAPSAAASIPPAPPARPEPRPEPAALPRAVQPAPSAPAAPSPVPEHRPAAAASDRLFQLPAAPRSVVLPLRPGAERHVTGGRGTEPFGSAARPRGRAGSDGEIFRLVRPVAAAPAPPASAAAASPAPPPIAFPAPASPVAPTPPMAVQRIPAAEPPAARPVPPATAPAAAAPAPAAAAPAPTAARWWDRPTEPAVVGPLPDLTPFDLMDAAPPAASTPAAPPASAPAAPAAPVASPAPRPAALADSAGVELQASGTLAVPELRPSDPGTATLGELYLRQGYVREAEEIFKQVLARDADNEAALSGLEAIGRRRAQKLTAAELLTGAEEPEVRGLTARKIQLLSRYLRTLRRGAGTDVPGTPQ